MTTHAWHIYYLQKKKKKKKKIKKLKDFINDDKNLNVHDKIITTLGRKIYFKKKLEFK